MCKTLHKGDEMTDIAIQANAAKQAEYKRHSFELRKLQKQNEEEYNKIMKTSKESISRTHNEREGAMATAKVELQNKLNEIKRNHDKRIKTEMVKFDTELGDLKKAHADQMAELTETHQKQISDTEKNHKQYLEAARLRFEQQKSKYES